MRCIRCQRCCTSKCTIIPNVQESVLLGGPLCCERSAFFSYFDGTNVYSGSAKATVCLEAEEGEQPQTVLDKACDDANKIAIDEAKLALARDMASGGQ